MKTMKIKTKKSVGISDRNVGSKTISTIRQQKQFSNCASLTSCLQRRLFKESTFPDTGNEIPFHSVLQQTLLCRSATRHFPVWEAIQQMIIRKHE